MREGRSLPGVLPRAEARLIAPPGEWRFSCWRRHNEERPHEGIDGDRPDERWEASPRPYPEKLATPEYPSHLELRQVSYAETLRLHHKQAFSSNALADEYIGLEEVDDGSWDIAYCEAPSGGIDEKTGRITGVEV